MTLPIFQTNNKDLTLLQNKWSSAINPVITNPSNNVIILKNIILKSGTNVINHLLGRTLQGYRFVRTRAAATIYDDQDSNQTPQLTLVLISNASVSVDIEVF